MGTGGLRHAPAALHPGKTRYLFYRRLDWPQGLSGRVRKILPTPGFDPRTVQPVASLYTDWAILASVLRVTGGWIGAFGIATSYGLQGSGMNYGWDGFSVPCRLTPPSVQCGLSRKERSDSGLTTPSLQRWRRVSVDLYHCLSCIPAWPVAGQHLPLLRINTKKMLWDFDSC